MKNILKDLRKTHNLTQKQLAEKVGVRRETIVFMEQGKYTPSLELAFKVAGVFGQKIEEVFIFN